MGEFYRVRLASKLIVLVRMVISVYANKITIITAI